MGIKKQSLRLVSELEAAFKNERNGKQRTVYQSVWLLTKGWNIEKVNEAVGLSTDRIRQLITLYNKGGLANLHFKTQPGNNHLLNKKQKEYIKKLITSKTPFELGFTGKYWSINLLKQLIEKEFKLFYKDQDSYRRLLIWCGFSFYKTDSLWHS